MMSAAVRVAAGPVGMPARVGGFRRGGAAGAAAAGRMQLGRERRGVNVASKSPTTTTTTSAAAGAGAATTTRRRRGVTHRVRSTYKDDIADGMFDDDEYPDDMTGAAPAASQQGVAAAADADPGYLDDYGLDEDDDDSLRRPRGGPRAPPSSRPAWAMREEAVSITPEQRRAAVTYARDDRASQGGGGYGRDQNQNQKADDGGGGGGGGGDGRWNSAATEMRQRMDAGAGVGSAGWGNEDIISDGGQAWFEGDDDWYEPEYREITAPEVRAAPTPPLTVCP